MRRVILIASLYSQLRMSLITNVSVRFRTEVITPQDNYTVTRLTSIVRRRVVLSMINNNKYAVVRFIRGAVAALLRVARRQVVSVVVVEYGCHCLNGLRERRYLLDLRFLVTHYYSVCEVNVNDQLMGLYFNEATPIRIIVPIIVRATVNYEDPNDGLQRRVSTRRNDAQATHGLNID